MKDSSIGKSEPVGIFFDLYLFPKKSKSNIKNEGDSLITFFMS